MLAIILLGPPGSGKGTQAKMLEEMGYHHFQMSKHLAGREIFRQKMAMGERIDCSAVIETAFDALPHTLPEHIVFDGIPRSVEQARWLINHLVGNGYRICVIDLCLGREEVQERISQRREGRPDDLNPKSTSLRIKEYYEDYGPQVTNYLRTKMLVCGTYHLVGANQPVSAISRSIRSIIYPGPFTQSTGLDYFKHYS